MIDSSQEQKFLGELLEAKQKAVFELQQDLRYLETFKGSLLAEGADAKARASMAELKRKGQDKDGLTEAEQAELEAVLEFIQEVKKTVTAYEKTKKVLNEVQEYISCLKSL